jgi:hypothetical protein
VLGFALTQILDHTFDRIGVDGAVVSLSLEFLCPYQVCHKQKDFPCCSISLQYESERFLSFKIFSAFYTDNYKVMLACELSSDIMNAKGCMPEE